MSDIFDTDNTEKYNEPAVRDASSENTAVNEETVSESAENAESIKDSNGSDDGAVAPSGKNSAVLGFYDIFETVAFSVAIVFICFTFLFRICVVDGQSMENTLYHNEKLVVSQLFGSPERGDIIVFHETGYFKEPLVKRVIATENEWIDIKLLSDNTLQVTVYDSNMENPRVLEEHYAAYKNGYGYSPATYNSFPKQVPEGHLFVMGDNRNNSSDSRSSLVGFVDARRVLGKVLIRITPLSRFGTVD